jgi:cysteine desulfurase family protein (TIGR01976 family)
MSHADAQLDLDYVRGQFPGLSEWAFFENAGGTLVPRSVIERVNAYMRESQVQPGASYHASALASERIGQAQRRIAAMINAAPEEVAIGPSTTMNVYLLAQALRPWLRPGDELVVTNLDHEANNGAWRRLAELGVAIKEWRLDPDSAELELEALEALLSERTRLVCVTHCSNITGSLHDVRTIARRVHEAGALICVDGVACAPHRSIDVKALDVDFYALSLYKLYGPHLGLLYGKREHLLRARGQNHYFIGEENIPLKLIPGGVNHELTAGLAGIADYFDAVHAHHFPGSNAGPHERCVQVFDLAARHEEALARRFLDFLTAKPNVRVIGRTTPERSRRVPTFSFAVADRNAEEVPPALEPHKIAIRAGDFYAARCIEALGLAGRGGVVRASMVHYNTSDEVERLIRHLDRVL